MFVAGIFRTDKKEKQSKYPSTNEWIKTTHKNTQWVAIQSFEMIKSLFATTQMEIEVIMLSEMS